MLLNIDKPNDTATLHNEGCSMIPMPLGTKYKLVGSMGRDGGWFAVSNEVEARAIARREQPSADFASCQHCNR